MPTSDEVLLSKGDDVLDSNGKVVSLFEGMRVAVYMGDQDSSGKPDNLSAEGVVSRNHHGGWTTAARWVLKIDKPGIRHESEKLANE
jgi:hypothetical protein